MIVYRESAARAYAERVIAAVESYKAQHRNYTKTLEQVGFRTRTRNGQDLGGDWGLAYSGQWESSPAIFYPGLLPFSMNEYEFDKGRWTYTED